MAKQLLFQEAARAALLRGMNAVADAVGATYGPRGQTVVLSRLMGPALVTKDGVTVASTISLADEWENEGAKLIQEVAKKTNQEAGDGTTAATVLARALFREGCELVSSGADRRAVERGMHLAVDEVVRLLHQLAIPVQRDDFDAICHVATIAANGDEELGTVIARAIQRVGLEGVITLDQSATTETVLDVSEGLQLERGFLSPLFMVNRARGETVFDKCNVFVTDARLIDSNRMASFLSTYCEKCGKVPLLLICEDCEGGALQLLAVNNGRSLAVVPVRTPGSGPSKKEEIEDIAILTGARVYSVSTGDDPANLRIEDLGSADRVIVTPYRTTIIGGHGQPLRVETRKEELRARIADPETKDFAKAQLERRLAMLSASIAVIKIGANVHSKLLEKRDRIEDSVNATLAALREGIVPGGGTALIRCLPGLQLYLSTLDEGTRLGASIVAHALTQPLTQLAVNAGVDPHRIVRSVEAVDHLMRWPELVKLLDRFWPRHPWHVQLAASRGQLVGVMRHWGYNAADDRLENLVLSGIIDPVKVVRLALQNSAELTGLLLTTAALVVDRPEPQPAPRPEPQRS